MTDLELLETAPGCVGQAGIWGAWEHWLHWGHFGECPRIFYSITSARFRYAEHSPAITHSEFLHVVLNKLLIIFLLIIHLTEEQVE